MKREFLFFFHRNYKNDQRKHSTSNYTGQFVIKRKLWFRQFSATLNLSNTIYSSSYKNHFVLLKSIELSLELFCMYVRNRHCKC